MAAGAVTSAGVGIGTRTVAGAINSGNSGTDIVRSATDLRYLASDAVGGAFGFSTTNQALITGGVDPGRLAADTTLGALGGAASGAASGAIQWGIANRYTCKYSPCDKGIAGKSALGDSGADDNIPPGGFRDRMTPEELVRYNKWWESKTWSMVGDGAVINGRKYTVHSLERMASNTPEIKATLETRARTHAAAKGYKPGTAKYNDYVNKYVQPRNIPPLVIEDAIINGAKSVGNKPGTWVYQTEDVKVIVNVNGDVVTVIPK